jgi:hypothetical protein
MAADEGDPSFLGQEGRDDRRAGFGGESFHKAAAGRCLIDEVFIEGGDFDAIDGLQRDGLSHGDSLRQALSRRGERAHIGVMENTCRV